MEDARENAARNGVANAAFLCGDVGDLATGGLARAAEDAAAALARAGAGGGATGARAAAAAAPPAPSAASLLAAAAAPDVVVVDPARAGLSSGAVSWLAQCGARRVVYVSCNPATQARDVSLLVSGPEAAYELASVTPLDMFPHTDHAETCAVLQRRVASA